MYTPVSITLQSLKRKGRCINVTVPAPKRSKLTKDLVVYKTNSEIEPEKDISVTRDITGCKKPEKINYYGVTESNEEDYISLSDVSVSVNESNIEKDDSNSQFPLNINLFSNNLGKSSHVISKIEYQVDCLRYNAGNIFQVPEDHPNRDRRLITEDYYHCLEKSKRYFNDVPSIECGSNKFLDYDPSLDDSFPNLDTFTNLELSLLREASCGCRPLTWNEFEKCHLIDRGKNSSEFVDKLKNSIIEFDNPVKKNKYIIEDLKFYHHNFENELFIIENSDDQHADNNLNSKEEIDNPLEDPLECNAEHRNSQNNEAAVEEILPISAEELAYIKKRLQKFKLTDVKKSGSLDFPSREQADTEESSGSAGGAAGSSNEIIVIPEPPKVKNISAGFSSQTIDTIADSFDDILKILQLSKNKALELPSSSSKASDSSERVSDRPKRVSDSSERVSDSSKRVKPLNFGGANEGKIIKQLPYSKDCEKFGEFVTNLAMGVVINDEDLQLLKDIDSKKEPKKSQIDSKKEPKKSQIGSKKKPKKSQIDSKKKPKKSEIDNKKEPKQIQTQQQHEQERLQQQQQQQEQQIPINEVYFLIIDKDCT